MIIFDGMFWRWLLIFLSTLNLHAQGELPHRNYTTESGLLSNTVFEIFQDKKGYMYICHDKGMNMFNGHYFASPFTKENVRALSNVTRLNDSVLIFRNFQGKNFQLRKDTLLSFPSPFDESWGYPTYIDDNGKIYVHQSNHVGVIQKNGTTREIKLDIPDVQRIYAAEFMNDQGYLFVTTKSGKALICIDLQRNKLIYQKDIHENANIRFFKDEEGIIWMDATTGEIGRFQDSFVTDIDLFDKRLPKETKITDLLFQPNGRKLISTFDGLYVFNARWELIGHFLQGIQCSDIFVDVENAIWIGSLQNGLFYIPSMDLRTVHASSIPGKNVKFSKFYTSKNTVYAGTYDGRIIQFNANGVVERTITLDAHAEIQSMYEFEGDLYVYCSALYCIELSSGRVKYKRKTGACKSLYVDQQGLIAGTSKGILVITDDVHPVYLDTLWMKNVFPLENSLLIAESTEDVFLFDYRNPSKIRMLSKGENDRSDLCRINQHTYLKSQHAVYRLDENFEEQKIFQTNKRIQRLFATAKELFVVYEDQSIQKIYPTQGTLFTSVNGQFLKELMFVGSIGDKMLTANNNDVQFWSDTRGINKHKPRLLMISKSGNYQENENGWTFPFDENKLKLKLDVLPNFYVVGQADVFYRVKGLDDDWNMAQKSDHHLIELIRLPSGNYTLEIYGQTPDGIKSEVLSFPLCIDKPYYFQWWFLLLCLLLLSGVVALFVKIRLRKIKAKNVQKLNEQRLKYKALNSELVAIRAQMNPHFIFNSLSSIQTKILNEDRIEAYKNVNTFAILLRQALQFTSKEFIKLQEELEFARNYITLEQTRTSYAFEYIEQIDPELSTEALLVPSLFLQPFIENAIRHGLMHSKVAKTLRLSVQKKRGGFEVIIEDNGIGRSASNAINTERRSDHTSFATKAIQDRIDILKEANKMNIELRIEDLHPGTRVIINFEAL